MPGAITRAHRGILFMDEAPEFSARALQTLREPMESGYVALSRTKGTTYYPAMFQMVMAANPCPCGYAYGNGERCVCKEKDRIRYFARLSGPILDRIDIQVEVPPVPCHSLGADPRFDWQPRHAAAVIARARPANGIPNTGGAATPSAGRGCAPTRR